MKQMKTWWCAAVVATSAILPARAQQVAPLQALVPIDGTAAIKVTRFTAAQAAQYRGGFTRDGGEVVCTVTTNANRICGAGWYATLNQRAPDAVRVTMEGKVEAGDGTGVLELYVDVSYMDGDHLWGQTAAFPVAPCEWRTRAVMLTPSKPIRSLGIYGIARYSEGLRARFRPPALEFFGAEGGPILFDGLPVKVAEPIGAPGFLLRDARAESGFAKVKDAARGVRLTTACEEKGGARFFDVTLADEQGGDRALTLAYALPLGGGKLSWFDSPRTMKDVTALKGECRETLASPCGAGCFSRWPFLAAAVDGKGIAIGFDPRRPAFSRVSLQAGLRLLYAAFDVALVPEKKSARLGFVVFPFEAKDGFRGALEAYQRLFPEFNEVKQTKQGNWMAFRKISKVQGWEDFGFAIKEADNETAWDDAHGITTYRYTEPSTWWMAIKGKDGRAQATIDECVAEAERLAAKGHRYAQAWKACAMKDENGRPYGRILDTPWCNGIVWNLNGAPGQGSKGEFAAKLGDDHFAKNYRGTFPEGLDGEYVDSSEMYVTAPLDFNRANFAGMDTPLTWSTYNLNPGVFKGMMGYEYVRGAWRKVRPLGRRMMANSTPGHWWWLAPYLDVMGTETNWGRNGKWTPMSDAALMYARALCGAKPFCFLMNTVFDTFTYEMAEKYMQRALAYGMYPSFFSANASSNHYFDNPAYYNRDRPLFKKYMPLCIRVGEAGWRPVNRLLASDSPDVITEQFGDRYATVYNLSEKPVRVTLTSLAGASAADELVNGGTWRFEDGRRTVEIPGETVFVLSFPVGCACPGRGAAMRELFNGRDLTNWYTFLRGRGVNCDPKGVFTVTNGVIHVSGEEFGCLTTCEEFSDYRLVVEYRWTGAPNLGSKKDKAPDSGILFHSTGPDGGFGNTWMLSHEYNLIVGASGDLWTVGRKDRPDIFVEGEAGEERLGGKYAIHKKGGRTVRLVGNDRLCRSDIARDWTDTYTVRPAANEKPIGEWNTAEIVCSGDTATFYFNGACVNHLTRLSPSRGKIQLQSEGCPIEFRRVALSPLPR